MFAQKWIFEPPLFWGDFMAVPPLTTNTAKTVKIWWKSVQPLLSSRVKKIKQKHRTATKTLQRAAPSKGVFIATQLNSTELNWTELSQLNCVQPSQSCFCLWRHDVQTESTWSLRSLIGDSCSRCERVDNSTSSWVELCRYKRTFSYLYGASLRR